MMLCLFEHMRSIVTLRNFGKCDTVATTQLSGFLGKILDFRNFFATFCGLIFQLFVGNCAVVRGCQTVIFGET
jgi:hypothetical protein